MKKYTITEFRKDYPDNDACLHKLFTLRYTNLMCPKCEMDKPFTKVKNRRSYQCPNCGFQLYPTQGTVFEKTTTPLTHWFYAIYLQTTTRNGVAAKELERQLNVCYKTALRMAHQIKILMMNNNEQLSGVVEIDDTGVGGSMENKHNKVRAAFKAMAVRDNMINKGIVMAAIQRNGGIIAEVIERSTRDEMEPIILKHIDYDTEVITDTARVFENLSEIFLAHHMVDHSKKEYVRGNIYTNTVEGFFSQLKRTIRGTHIHVSRKHLQKYVDEVAFRYMHKHRQDTMFEDVLQRIIA